MGYRVLVCGFIPLKNMSASLWMMIPNIWKNEIHVPNHQLGYLFANDQHDQTEPKSLECVAYCGMFKPFRTRCPENE